MIDHYGLNVCQPSPTASLKVLAAQIGDRDSGVRTAALNALVCVYAIVGEPLWKMLGQVCVFHHATSRIMIFYYKPFFRNLDIYR